MDADRCGANANRELISFQEWAAVLARATEIPDAQREAYRRAIIAFLGFCKRRHAGASVILIKAYLAQVPEQARSGAQEALRWWYRAAQRRTAEVKLEVEAEGQQPDSEGTRGGPADGRPRAEGGGRNTETEREARTRSAAPNGGGTQSRSTTEQPRGGRSAAEGQVDDLAYNHSRRQAGVPPPRADTDLGGPDWERDLIKACRERGFLWRTEETYRGWAVRFAAFLRPRSPYAAGREEVGAFLSHLAVTQRASGSTQKQAFRVKGFAPRGLFTM